MFEYICIYIWNIPIRIYSMGGLTNVDFVYGLWFRKVIHHFKLFERVKLSHHLCWNGHLLYILSRYRCFRGITLRCFVRCSIISLYLHLHYTKRVLTGFKRLGRFFFYFFFFTFRWSCFFSHVACIITIKDDPRICKIY